MLNFDSVFAASHCVADPLKESLSLAMTYHQYLNVALEQMLLCFGFSFLSPVG